VKKPPPPQKPKEEKQKPAAPAKAGKKVERTPPPKAAQEEPPKAVLEKRPVPESPAASGTPENEPGEADKGPFAVAAHKEPKDAVRTDAEAGSPREGPRPGPSRETRSADTGAEPKAKPQPRQPERVNLTSLPSLSESDKARYGLRDIKVNMTRPASKTRPYASAIINLQPVQVGERIPGSRAILIGVETRAIGIEIEGGSERYHIRF
jgi:hypothetical protein